MNATGIVITHVPRKFYDVSSGISVGWDGQLGRRAPGRPRSIDDWCAAAADATGPDQCLLRLSRNLCAGSVR